MASRARVRLAVFAGAVVLALHATRVAHAVYLVKLNEEQQLCLTPNIACSVLLDNLRYQLMPLGAACQYQKLSHVGVPIEQNGVPSSLACAGAGKSQRSRYTSSQHGKFQIQVSARFHRLAPRTLVIIRDPWVRFVSAFRSKYMADCQGNNVCFCKRWLKWKHCENHIDPFRRKRLGKAAQTALWRRQISSSFHFGVYVDVMHTHMRKRSGVLDAEVDEHFRPQHTQCLVADAANTTYFDPDSADWSPFYNFTGMGTELGIEKTKYTWRKGFKWMVTQSHLHKVRDVLKDDYKALQRQNLSYRLPLTVGMVVTIVYDKTLRKVPVCFDEDFTCTPSGANAANGGHTNATFMASGASP